MNAHVNPRFYVGPNTNEIVLSIGRSYGVANDIDNESVIIKFTKRVGKDSNNVSLWTSYAVIDGLAKFEIPEEFRTDAVNFTKGFYDGQVMLGDCLIGDVELIKAPGHYVGFNESIEDKCHGEQTWVEPECVIEPVTKPCNCLCNGDPVKQSNCPTCYNQVLVAKIGLIADYAGLSEINTEDCPLPEGGEQEICGDESQNNVNKPMISGMQESKLPEGYVEDVNDC